MCITSQSKLLCILERAGIKLENKGDLSFFYDEQANQVTVTQNQRF